MTNALLFLLICSVACCSSQASSIIPIALSGQSAPGTKGTFTSFGCVSLNDRGALAFSAITSDKSASLGIFVFNGGIVYPVALTGQVAPGTGGLPFQYLSCSKINNAGDLAFTAFVGDLLVRREGLFLYSRGVISSVALSGPLQPMEPIHFRSFSLNDSGAIAFAVDDGLFLFSDANGVTNGGSFQSRLILTNPSRVLPVLGQVNFFGDSGNPIALSFKELGGGSVNSLAFNIPPLGSAVFTTDGQGPPVNGFAQASSDNSLSGVVVFSLPMYGTSGVGSSAPPTDFIAPVSIKSASGINTGIAIANPSERSVKMELVLRKSTGEAVENGRATVTLPANGHIARFIAGTVDSFFPGTSATEFEGTVTATVTSIFGSVVATAVQVGPGQFTTVPVSPLR